MSAHIPEITPSLVVSDLDHYYETSGGPVQALAGCSFEVRGNEFLSIVGPSGCGKSTLIAIVAGLIKPSQGSVLLNGDIVSEPIREVGIVFQNPALLDWRDSLGNVLLQSDLRGLKSRDYEQRAREMLVQVGLSGFEDRAPYELSGGMQQRVAICRALLLEPPLVLMDEPFGALDAMTRDQMGLDLQAYLHGSERQVLFVTHSIQEAVLLSDRVLVISPRPGSVLRDIEIDLPRPRKPEVRVEPRFLKYVAEITKEFHRAGVQA